MVRISLLSSQRSFVYAKTEPPRCLSFLDHSAFRSYAFIADKIINDKGGSVNNSFVIICPYDPLLCETLPSHDMPSLLPAWYFLLFTRSMPDNKNSKQQSDDNKNRAQSPCICHGTCKREKNDHRNRKTHAVHRDQSRPLLRRDQRV